MEAKLISIRINSEEKMWIDRFGNVRPDIFDKLAEWARRPIKPIKLS